MSVYAMGHVFKRELPKDEKFVLLAYVDHADHDGNNIYPAVTTVAAKTGYSERSVQYITRKLERNGLLVNDGFGPNGTRKWKYNWGGAESAGVQPIAPGGCNPQQEGVQPIAPEPSYKPSYNMANEEKPSSSPSLPIEWQIAAGGKISEPNQRQAEMLDSANLIATGTGVMAELYRDIALAFMQERNIVLDIDKAKGQRKVIKSMLKHNVRPQHIADAVRKLVDKNMTVVDLFAVEKTAVDLAEQPEGHSFLEGV